MVQAVYITVLKPVEFDRQHGSMCAPYPLYPTKWNATKSANTTLSAHNYSYFLVYVYSCSMLDVLLSIFSDTL